MKEIEILGDNRFETFTRTRDGCRAVIVKPIEIFLHVYEYYEEYRYGGYCFI